MRSIHLYAGLVVASFLAMGCDNSGSNNEILNAPEPRTVADTSYTLTESGLKYFDFSIGDTTRVRADSGDLVVVHYHGWLENGRLFDSSILVNSPIQFILGIGTVIPGWDEGLNGMYLGGERQLVIPPELGYGNQDRGVIPANSTLIFEVVLLGTE